MRIVGSWGHRLLAIYLILVGLTMAVPGAGIIPPVVLGVIALIAGFLILIGR